MKSAQITALLLIVLTFTACEDDKAEPFIAVNMVGYNVDAPKKAYTVNTTENKLFELVDAESKEIVKTGTTGNLIPAQKTTGDSLSVIDFSSIRSTGKYILRLKKQPQVHSAPFNIEFNPYKKVALGAIQSYYYNRCGTAVGNGKPWKHSVCHVDDAVFYDNSKNSRDVQGGWHDAGDYGKYSVNTALSVGLLLNLYQTKPKLFSDGQLQIPEAQNGVPDILDEVRWGLEWLMKMQDTNGGVFHKVSRKKWTGEYLPQNDPNKRYIFQISSNATASFAAVAALGAQIYDDYDQKFAERLRTAALESWDYLQRHPVSQPLGGFSNPEDVEGGEYSDYKDKDTRMWAAVELYRLTGNEKYTHYFVNTYPEMSDKLPPLSFKNFEALALGTFLQAELPDKEIYNKTQKEVLRQFKSHSKVILWEREQNNYGSLLQNDEYYWGSSGANLGYAFELIQLYEKTNDRKYYRAARDQLHYTLGRNPLNQSLITGIGSRSVENPYHQFSMKLDVKRTIPGMMVGGANNKITLNGKSISEYPAKSYEDKARNYYVNEPAINWTAIFAYTAGYFSSSKRMLSKKQN